ncbi:hypothetical protein AURDEDRAFT_117538 [Auricularia subglabra TFB-10046 SS5]|uniref:Uncharacterized protein n=1 Tax=Auricularia subglabra (strain TFB-10046 / SS5) TaxID=717982 RepID=J0WQQ6_AURST|nr:hypothetical protein AURDEDRAFT_117538 [Auricularia subglabra TFB-10046 SS5]
MLPTPSQGPSSTPAGGLGAPPNRPLETVAGQSDDGTQIVTVATDSAGLAQPSVSQSDAPLPGHSPQRAAIIGGSVAGAFGLILLFTGLFLLRRRLIARRAASHDFIRARAIAAWNDHWTVRPSSPGLDSRIWDQISEAGASQPSRVSVAM